MCTAATLRYVRAEEAKFLGSRSLRLCPTCVRSGFHSPFHQLLFIPTCPIHGEPLQTTCAACGHSTAPYSLIREAFRQPYGCGTCGAAWWLATVHGEKILDEQAAVWHEIDEWLLKRKDAGTIEADIAKMARFLSDADSFQASVRRLPSRWSDVIGVKAPRRSNGQREPDLHLTVEFPCRDTRAEITKETERREFAVVYRTIRRKLTQRLRKRHWQCLEQMTRSILLDCQRPSHLIEFQGLLI